MEETEFLRSGTTMVTSNRIEIDGQTFAVRNVGSVKVTAFGTPWGAILGGLFAAFVAGKVVAAWFGLLVVVAVGA